MVTEMNTNLGIISLYECKLLLFRSKSSIKILFTDVVYGFSAIAKNQLIFHEKTFVFPEVILNLGNGFENGIFKCPCKGDCELPFSARLIFPCTMKLYIVIFLYGI